MDKLSREASVPFSFLSPLSMRIKPSGKEFALCEDIDDFYFFEVSTKYISSNALKMSVISRVRSTSEIADIFNT